LRRAIGFALVWSLASGAVFIPGVWAATFYVDDSGDDGRTPAEAQNPATPWQTITRAIGEATLASGDGIQVGAGTYDQALGETFPLSLVDGVALIGDPDNPDSRVVSGPGASVLFLNADTPLASGTTLSGFRLTHEAAATANVAMSFTLASADMAPRISNNDFAGLPGDDLGINILDTGSDERSFTGAIEGNSFSDWYRAVQAIFSFTGTPADLSPSIHDNSFTDNHHGVWLEVGGAYEGTASPAITDNSATGSGNTDIYLAYNGDSGHGATLTPLISGNTVSGSAGGGIRLSFNEASMSGTSGVATFSPTILNNIIASTAYDALKLDWEDPYCEGTFISDITVAGNTITNAGSTGIEFSFSSFSYPVTMDFDLTITNNTITSSASRGIGVDIYSSAYSVGGDIDITVAGNTITDSGAYGIEINVSSFSSSCVFDLSVMAQGNVVIGSNSIGIEVDVDHGDGFLTSRTDVLDNVIDGGTDGLEFDLTGFVSAISYAQVACNTITNNTRYGIRLWGDSEAPPPDFGGGDLGSPGFNTLMSNTVYDFYNHDADDVDAHSNWWGTTDDATIDSHIFDDNEDGTKGAVLYSGWMSAAPTVLATANLVDALEVDLLPTGPSGGDTFRYTATLEGTGDCGCAAALFTVPIPDNGIFIPDSLTASRGILINEGVSTLHPELKVGLGALEAGETVTITWDVMAGGGCSMTSQATLSCYQLGDLLTDDPDAGGGSDPTTVILDHLFCDGFESGDTDIWSSSAP